MPQTHPIAELAPEERTVVERLLGRALRNDEAVEIVTHSLAARDGSELSSRRQAAERILALAKGKTTGGLSARDLIEEARIKNRVWALKDLLQ